MTFDKRILLDNIYRLAKEKNVKIGDLEKEIGLSTGYLSRLNKDGSTAIPSIELIATVADKFGITIDGLVYHDYSKMTETDKYLVSFLQKLIGHTDKLEMIWKQVTKDDLVADCNSLNKKIPFHKNGSEDIDFDIFTPVVKKELIYDSLFHPDDDVKIAGKMFSAKMDDYSELYIIPVRTSSMPQQAAEYELYLKASSSISPICHSSWNDEIPYNGLLEELYKMAEISTKVPVLGQNVKDAIDAFMKK